MVMLCVFIPEPCVSLYLWTMVMGLSLFLSDVIHHFLVLWPIVGDPEFHLVYPNRK